MARRIAQRTAKILLRTLGYVAAFALGLLVLIFLILVVPPLRTLAVQQGVAYANQQLDGYKVALRRVDRLDPWGVKLRGIEVFDAQHRPLLNVPWLLVELKPLALFKNTLALTRVQIDGARAHLYPTDPNAPQEEETEEPASEPSSFTIRADRVRVRDASLVTDWSGRTVHARIGALVAGGQWGPRPALALEQATIRVTADDDELLRLRTTQGSWNADKGGDIGVEALLAGAPLTLRAAIPALADVQPWPVQSAELRLHRVTRRSLTLLGVEDGAQLNAALDLALEVRAKDDRIDAQLQLRSGPSRIQLDASADPERYEAALQLPPTRLSGLAGMLPDMKLGAALRAHATPGYDPDSKTLTPKEAELSWSDLVIDEGKVPSGTLQVELPLPVIRLVAITLRGMESALAASGQYDTQRGEGQAALDFNDFELNRIDLLQRRGVAGLFNGGLSAKFGPHAIAANGDLRLLEFAHPSASVDQLALAFAVKGSPSAPRGNMNLRVGRLKAGDLQLDSVRSQAQVTTRDVAAHLQVRGPDSAMRAEITGQRSRSGELRMMGLGRGSIAKKEVRFDLRELIYGKKGVSVEELCLYSGKQGVRISGSLDERQAVDAQLALVKIDLAEWTKLAGVEDVGGTLDGTARVQGTTAQPRVDTSLSFTNAHYRSDLPVDATLHAKGDLEARHAEVALSMKSSAETGAKRKAKKEMQSREPLQAELEISVDLPKRPRDLARAAKRGRITANVIAHVPVRQLSAVGGDALAGLDGVLDWRLQADGTLDDPTLATELRARLKLPEQKGDPQEALRLTANVTKEQGKLELWTQDEDGQLLALNGFVVWPGGNPRAAFEKPADWQNARFKLQAELRERRLDLFQGVFAYFSKLYALDLPLRAGGKLFLEGDRGRLDGAAKLQAVVFGDKLDGRCALGTQSAIDFDAKLKQDRVTADLTVRTDGGGIVRGAINSHLALNALNGAEPVFGPAKLDVQGKDIAIHKLPGLCNLADGRASFSLAASGLGKERPRLDLKATITDLHAPGNSPMSVEAKARAGGSSAELHADLKGPKGSFGTLGARVALAYPEGTTPTLAASAPFDAHLHLEQLPLANVLAFTEAVGNVKGSASADLTVKGKLNDPYPAGHIELKDVNMTIAKLAQPLRELNGRIEIKGRSVKIPKLTARDRDGTLRVEGYASLAQDLHGEAGVYVEADEFPLRQQGTIIGELTTRARLDMKMLADLRATAQLKILDGRIWLTGERGKKVQALDAHPHVRFSDEKVEHEATAAEEQAAGKEGFAFASFKIRTERELWFMHKDFSMQVGVDLELAQNEHGPALTGQASIQRGELKLLGKIFVLDKDSAIRFTGPMPPDPELDIRATFEPPTGKPLIVEVTGPGSAPVLAFSGAATNVGEAVAVLTGRNDSAGQGQGGQGDPTTAMAKVASSMTAGLLVMTARREFGDWVPMITVETGESGQPTSARAGFDASKLIPEWLDGIAKGAYVEGIFGSGNSGGGRGGVGVRLEVALPRDFVTTLGLGPNSAWSTDVAWAP
jgi:hypothetical protein